MIGSVDKYNNVQKCYYTNYLLIINTVTIKSRELMLFNIPHRNSYPICSYHKQYSENLKFWSQTSHL